MALTRRQNILRHILQTPRLGKLVVAHFTDNKPVLRACTEAGLVFWILLTMDDGSAHPSPCCQLKCHAQSCTIDIV